MDAQPMNRVIVGLDPGVTTGMAVLEYNDKVTIVKVLGQVENGRQGFYRVFAGSQFGWPYTRDVVSEQWVERNVKGANREPQYIEGVQYALWLDTVYYQTPDQKKRVTDDKLRELGLWTEGKRHQMDALIHALVWLLDHGHMPTIKALSGEDPNGIQIAQQQGQGEGEGEGEDQDETNGGDEGEPDDGDHDPNCAERAAEAANDALAEALGEALAESIAADPQNDGELAAELSTIVKKEVQGTRAERDLGGAFAGYRPAEETTGVLYEVDF